MQSIRPICLACVSFDVEAADDSAPAEIEYFACFDCQDVFYFLTDARPRVRRRGLSELYGELGVGATPGRASR